MARQPKQKIPEVNVFVHFSHSSGTASCEISLAHPIYGHLELMQVTASISQFGYENIVIMHWTYLPPRPAPPLLVLLRHWINHKRTVRIQKRRFRQLVDRSVQFDREWQSPDSNEPFVRASSVDKPGKGGPQDDEPREAINA